MGGSESQLIEVFDPPANACIPLSLAVPPGLRKSVREKWVPGVIGDCLYLLSPTWLGKVVEDRVECCHRQRFFPSRSCTAVCANGRFYFASLPGSVISYSIEKWLLQEFLCPLAEER